MMHNILEISDAHSKNGKVPIKIALHKIHDNPDEVNKNGLHWKEEYAEKAILGSGAIPICAEFIDTDKKDVPFGHGLTGEIINIDGNREAVFETSETPGMIESYSIETVKDDNNNDIRVVAGTGYIFSQRYPNFLKWLRENYAIGKVCTSIEIMGLSENNNDITYEEEKPTPEKRTPKDFLYSGIAILSIPPADDDSVILELSQRKENKEENKGMEFNMEELKNTVQSVISELNDKSASYEAKIAELNSQIEEQKTEISNKETTISELNALRLKCRRCWIK